MKRIGRLPILCLGGGDIRIDAIAPFRQLRAAVRQHGESRRAFCHSVGGLILPRDQCRKALLGVVGLMGVALCLLAQRGALLRVFPEGCADLLRAVALFLRLGAERVRALGAGCQLAAQTLDVLAAVLQPGLQNRGGAVALRGGGLRRALAFPELLRLHIPAAHLLGEILRRGVEVLQRPLGVAQIGADLLIFRVQGSALTRKAVQRIHPDGDFQGPLLVPEDEEFFRGLRLLFQRTHLQLKLADLIVDADEIFLRPLQAALRLLLAVAKAGNPRRLFKNLPPVGTACGDDLRDAPLADDAVPVPAQAGVHQQTHDILEPHTLPVEGVFALPGAVIAPGNDNLRRVDIK